MAPEQIRQITLNAIRDLKLEISEDQKMALANMLSKDVEKTIAPESLKSALQVRFEYEKHYLGLLKEHKEEIKFAASLQEDLRKERAKFFAETLREVAQTLRDADVAGDVASGWLEELVDSYTASLNLSSGLAEDKVIDTIGKMREGTRAEMTKIDSPQS
ncbi:hypothetical protein [Cupriavidus sp. H18C2]|uniref:hypothetical protein n=1 Tax=Cupriavidus sp. H18C2 TaxID=3241602 RepID=UPI003BF87B30